MLDYWNSQAPSSCEILQIDVEREEKEEKEECFSGKTWVRELKYEILCNDDGTWKNIKWAYSRMLTSHMCYYGAAFLPDYLALC